MIITGNETGKVDGAILCMVFIGYDKVFRHYPECSVKPLKDFSEIPFAL